MKTTFKYKNKKISLEVKQCNFIERFVGLMFTRKKKAKALLFDFGKFVGLRIHSMFVFFPFIAVWLDQDNKVIDIQKVKPWRLSVFPRTKQYNKLVEIPINNKYSDIIESLDGS